MNLTNPRPKLHPYKSCPILPNQQKLLYVIIKYDNSYRLLCLQSNHKCGWTWKFFLSKILESISNFMATKGVTKENVAARSKNVEILLEIHATYRLQHRVKFVERIKAIIFGRFHIRTTCLFLFDLLSLDFEQS